MMNKLWAMRNRKNKRGFTLIELIIVIAILAILMMIAIPAMSTYIKDSRERTAEANARTAYGAVMAAGSEFTIAPTSNGGTGNFEKVETLKGSSSKYFNKVGELLGENFKGEIKIEVSGEKVTVSWRQDNTSTPGVYPKTA